MNEIFESIFRAAGGAAISLADAAPVKTVIAGALAIWVSDHMTALSAFTILVVIDLLTKFLALSHQRLTDLGKSAGLFKCFLGVPAALRDDYIKSEMMKHKFAGKIILYMALVTTAVHVDAMAGGQDLFLKVAWYYLAATEALSIIENLRDAGVKSLEPLLNFVRSKLGGLK